MQKKLIALAVAGLASTAAFAQTNVVVYGIADGSFDVVKSSGALNQTITYNDPATGITRSLTVGDGQNIGTKQRVSANSSYIGFKGTEDLGNGLKAIFQYEAGVDFTSGVSALTANRDSFVGLTGGFGTIVMGNLTGPTRALGNALDVNAGATGIGSNSGVIGKMSTTGFGTGINPQCGPQTTCASAFDTRWANAIAYVSPNFAGFTAVGAYVANENKTKDYTGQTAFEGEQRNTTGYDLGLKWEGMGFMAGLTYNYYETGGVGVNSGQFDNWRLGGSYTGGWGSVRAMWEQTSASYGNGGAATWLTSAVLDNKQQKWGLGGTFNIGKGAILAQYYQALDTDKFDNSGAQLFEIGYQYNMSKRTMLKATYAMIKNDNLSNMDFGVNAVGINGGLNTPGCGTGYCGLGLGSDVQGFQVGVRHAF